MHELAITQGILDICLKHASEANARRIVGINLVIGQLSSIVDDSVQFYWDIISDGTIAKGAKLNFQRIPADMRCLDCGEVFTQSDKDFACPSCSSIRVRINKGIEMRVESIDVE